MRLLRILGHPNVRSLTPVQVFFDLELLREDRRRERIHTANATRAASQEAVTDEAFQKFLDATP